MIYLWGKIYKLQTNTAINFNDCLLTLFSKLCHLALQHVWVVQKT